MLQRLATQGVNVPGIVRHFSPAVKPMLYDGMVDFEWASFRSNVID